MNRGETILAEGESSDYIFFVEKGEFLIKKNIRLTPTDPLVASLSEARMQRLFRLINGKCLPVAICNGHEMVGFEENYFGELFQPGETQPHNKALGPPVLTDGKAPYSVVVVSPEASVFSIKKSVLWKLLPKFRDACVTTFDELVRGRASRYHQALSSIIQAASKVLLDKIDQRLCLVEDDRIQKKLDTFLSSTMLHQLRQINTDLALIQGKKKGAKSSVEENLDPFDAQTLQQRRRIDGLTVTWFQPTTSDFHTLMLKQGMLDIDKLIQESTGERASTKGSFLRVTGLHSTATSVPQTENIGRNI